MWCDVFVEHIILRIFDIFLLHQVSTFGHGQWWSPVENFSKIQYWLYFVGILSVTDLMSGWLIVALAALASQVVRRYKRISIIIIYLILGRRDSNSRPEFILISCAVVIDITSDVFEPIHCYRVLTLLCFSLPWKIGGALLLNLDDIFGLELLLKLVGYCESFL